MVTGTGFRDGATVALLRGTEKRTFEQIYDALESVGAHLGFSAGTHTAGFSGRALVEDLPLLFDLTQRQAIVDSLTPSEVQVYNEVSALSRLMHLRPVIFIRYQRKAFWAKGDERLRITFDSDISYDVVNHDCLSPLTNTQLMLEGDQIAMEIKANGRIPFWVLELIKECGCRMVRFSKYCLGVQRSQELRGMYLNHTGKETAPPPVP